MSATETRRTHPRYADQLGKDAGWALKHTGRTQRVVSDALGQHESLTSRQCSGKEPSAVSRFYETVRDFVVRRDTDAGPLIAGAMATAVETCLDEFTAMDLTDFLALALNRETEAQACEDSASFAVVVALARTRAADATPADLEALDRALVAWEAATLEETSWHLTAMIYARALRVARGKRVGPGR